MKKIISRILLISFCFQFCIKTNGQTYGWVKLTDSVMPFGLMFQVGALACDGNNNLYATTANPVFGYSIVKYNNNAWRDTHIGGADESSISTFRADTLGEVYNIVTKGVISSGYIYGFKDTAISFYDTAYSSQMHPNGIENFKVGKNGNIYTQSYLNNVEGIFQWNRTTNNWNRLKGVGADTLNKNLYNYTLFTTAKNSNPVVITSTGNLKQWSGIGWVDIGINAALLNNLHTIRGVVLDKNGYWYGYGKLQGTNTVFRAIWNETTNSWIQLINNSNSPYSDTCIDINSIAYDKQGNYYGISKCVNSNNQQFVAKWNGTSWQELGTLNANNLVLAITIDTAGTVYAGGMFTDANNHIYVAKYTTITPVNLSNFSSKIVENNIELNWQTLTETNSNVFEIERSKDGKNFVRIGSVFTKKTSGMNDYSFIDNAPDFLNHYRLKQIDNDGKFSYSKILFVKMPSANPLKVLLNPAKNYIEINIAVEDSKLKELVLYDLYGKKMSSCKAHQGNQKMNVQTLANGKYLLYLQTNTGETYLQQVVIIKD